MQNQSIEIPWRTLKTVACAMSKDQTRYVLNGVCVEARNAKELVLVATDGRTLIAALVKTEHKMEKGEQIILPMLLIQKTVADLKRVVLVEIYDGWVGITSSLRANTIKLSMKPIDGIYPKWRQVVAKPKGELVAGPHPAFGSQTMELIIAAKKIATGQKSVFLHPYRDSAERPCRSPNYIQLDTDAVAIFMPSRFDEDQKFLLPEWAIE